MPSSYELWLTDDSGRRIALLNTFTKSTGYFSYSRTIRGYGTCLVGMPYKEYREKIFPIFQPDWRIDIFRSPEIGYPMRREQTYFLRMPKIYTRDTDNVQMIALYGRDPKDLLRRRWIVQPAGYPQTLKRDYADDMMKDIVREQMLYGSCLDEDAVQDNSRAFPRSEFTVQGNVSLGPALPLTCSDRNVLDVLKELRDSTFQAHEENPTSVRRIFFDMVSYDIQGYIDYILDEDGNHILDENGDPLQGETTTSSTAVQGFQFTTFADLRGQDRTASALIFSVENSNLRSPYYTLNHMEEENSIVVKGFGRGDSRPSARLEDTQRAGSSRWNLCEGLVDASTEPNQGRLEGYAYQQLHDKAPKEEISCTFLNVPGSEDTPRSLYGIDWDLGDLVPVEYAGKQINVEIEIVYVAIDETGRETITGTNGVYSSDQ